MIFADNQQRARIGEGALFFLESLTSGFAIVKSGGNR
jgi:hypothetical protein